jgi:hypothetical protein
MISVILGFLFCVQQSMPKVEFSAQQKEQLIQKLKKYMSKDVEIGQFDVDFLMDFISKEMGPFITIRACKMPKPF